MVNTRNDFARRGFFATAAVATLGGMVAHGCAPAKVAVVPGNRPFGLTKEGDIGVNDPGLSHRARELVRIGNDGIARENAAALEAFFHPQFRFHGPGGAELDRETLWAYFAACRAAFDEFSVSRQSIVSDGSAYIASRTTFAGVFARPFTASPEGTLPPNGKRFGYQLINLFRYAPEGQLIEEWVQYDTKAFLDQLR